MRLLITSGLGFVGINLEQFLARKDVEAKGFCRKKELDILNADHMRQTMKKAE